MDQNTRDVLVLGLGMLTTFGTGWLALQMAQVKAHAALVETKVNQIAGAVIERRGPRKRIPVEGRETQNRDLLR